MTTQFVIEDHALRHSWHHLARIRKTVWADDLRGWLRGETLSSRPWPQRMKCSSPAFPPVSGGRQYELALECTIERRLGLVADVGCDLRNAARRRGQSARRQLKPPAHQISHRWFGNIARESLHQSGARKSDFSGQFRDRPGMLSLAMQQRQTLPDDRISRTGKPSNFLLRKTAQYTAVTCRRKALRTISPAWLRFPRVPEAASSTRCRIEFSSQ